MLKTSDVEHRHEDDGTQSMPTMATVKGNAVQAGIRLATASFTPAPRRLSCCCGASTVTAAAVEAAAPPLAAAGGAVAAGRNRLTERLPSAEDPALVWTLQAI